MITNANSTPMAARAEGHRKGEEGEARETEVAITNSDFFYIHTHTHTHNTLLKIKERKEQSNILPWSEVKSLSRVRLFATRWTVAYKAPLPMEFSRQAYWSGLPFPSPGELPEPGIEPGSPALQADTLPSEPPGKPTYCPEHKWFYFL